MKPYKSIQCLSAIKMSLLYVVNLQEFCMAEKKKKQKYSMNESYSLSLPLIEYSRHNHFFCIVK